MLRFIAKFVFSAGEEAIAKYHTFTDNKELEKFLKSHTDIALVGVEVVEDVPNVDDCPYCSTGEMVRYKTNKDNIVIVTSYIDPGDDFVIGIKDEFISIKFNFCPMCGRRLGVKNEK